jgi:hypothetical protein
MSAQSERKSLPSSRRCCSTDEESALSTPYRTHFPSPSSPPSVICLWIEDWLRRNNIEVPDETLSSINWDGEHFYKMLIPEDSVPDLMGWGFAPASALLLSRDIAILRRKKLRKWKEMARCTDKLQILGVLLVLLGVVAILKYLQAVGTLSTSLWGIRLPRFERLWHRID